MGSPSSFKVQLPPRLDPNVTVGELILASGEWNAKLIREAVIYFEAIFLIFFLSLAKPNGNKQDSIVWHYGKREIYTVRNGYYKAREFNEYAIIAGPSRHTVDEFWKKVWYMKTLPKVRIFLWRACQEIIPIKGNLTQRHIPVALECPMCGSPIESSAHALIFCPLVEPA